MKKILGCFLVLGFLFRLLYLGTRQLWTEEIMQALVVRRAPAELFQALLTGMTLPAPLDYFIQHGPVWLFGESPWALRIHAAVLGTLSVWLVFRIARRMFGDRVAIFAGVLFFLYPLAYHYSQEGRPHALLLLLSLASYDQLFRIVGGAHVRWTSWVWLAGLQVLLLYSSLAGAVVIFAQVVGMLLSMFRSSTDGTSSSDARPASIGTVATFCSVSALAFLLVVPWWQYAGGSFVFQSIGAGADARVLVSVLQEVGDGSLPMAAVVILAAAIGVHGLKRHGRAQQLLWLLSWVFASIAAVIPMDFVIQDFYATQHVLHWVPPLVLLAAYGMAHLGEQLTILDQPPYRASAPSILYAIVWVSISCWIIQDHWRRAPVDWLGTARFLENSVGPQDAVSIPEVYALLGYHSAALPGRRVPLDAQRTVENGRYWAACYDSGRSDPCAGFREAATGAGWQQRSFRGFTLFVRDAAAAPQ